MAVAYLNIGSNQGHREDLIDHAVALIERLCGSKAIRSDIFESEPWGYKSPNRYLNLGIAVDTTIHPEELLDCLLDIEQAIAPAAHRDANGAYIDRPLDIDIIAMVDDRGKHVVIDTPKLTLPHPRMHLRDFVLVPMSQIAPLWRHPLLDLTASELL